MRASQEPAPNYILWSIRISGLSNGGEFAPLFIAGNTIDGNIELDSSSIGSGIGFIGEVAPNLVGGNIRVDGNQMGLRVTSNNVSGHLRATGNGSGVGALSVSNNTIGGNTEYSRNGITPLLHQQRDHRRADVLWQRRVVRRGRDCRDDCRRLPPGAMRRAVAIAAARTTE